MKHLLLATIAAVLVVGCAKAPDISMHDAAAIEDIESVKQHLAADTDVNAKNKYDMTSLYLAAATGHKKIVELLTSKGADVNVKDKHKLCNTTLDRTIEKNYTEITDILRKHGGKTGEELKAEGKEPPHLSSNS